MVADVLSTYMFFEGVVITGLVGPCMYYTAAWRGGALRPWRILVFGLQQVGRILQGHLKDGPGVP